MTKAKTRQQSKAMQASDGEDDTGFGNGGDTVPSTPTKSNSSHNPPHSLAPSGDTANPFIFEATDADFNTWIRPLSEDDLSEVEFHQIVDEVLAMLDASHFLVKSKDSYSKKELAKHKKTVEHRLICIGCAIGHLDSQEVQLVYERLHESVNHSDPSPPMLFKNKCLTTITKMILFTGMKSKVTDSEQKRADRMSKNKKSFYPEKLAKASDLLLFLQALELECKRVPHWEECITFKAPSHKKSKLYNFFRFINDSLTITAMEKCTWATSKSCKDEGYLTLYMATWSSLSTSLQHEMSTFKEEINFNGSKLLVKIISALRPEISVLRNQAMDYIGALDETCKSANWDLLTIIPTLIQHVRTLINVNDSLDLVWTKVFGAMSACTNTHFQHHIMQWNTNHQHEDPKSGKKILKFLKKCLSYVHDSIRKTSWTFATPSTYTKKKGGKRKVDESDLALSSFNAESSKKAKSEDKSSQSKEYKALQAKFKQTENTLSQVQANYAKQKTAKTGGGKQQERSHQPGPPKHKGNFNPFDENQFGGKATFKDESSWMNFIRGTTLDKAHAKNGVSVYNADGKRQIWFWCSHCNKCGNHKEEYCKRKNNPKKVKQRSYDQAYPAPITASIAAVGETETDKDDIINTSDLGSYSESENDE